MPEATKNILRIPCVYSIRYVLLLLDILIIQISFAQSNPTNQTPDTYRAVNWGLDEGLSHGSLYSMLKDVKGFLWVATPFGLNRFDGSSFKKYIADKNKKNKTIIGNDILGLKEDSLHNIWIGTDKGLSCYDTRADTFRNISSNLPGNLIIPFWATRDEVFCWDYPEHQWAAFNIHTFAKRSLARFKDTDTVGFSITNQYAIFETGSNSVWMEKGFRGVSGGLLQVSLADGTRNEFNWPCHKKIPNHSHFSEGMRYDRKRNSIWISSPDGLMEFTLDDKKFHHIDALNEIVNQKDFFQYAGIDIDPRGRIWVGTHPTGIIIYNPANNSVTLPFPNDSIQQRNVSDENVSLYCDKDGMVWSGSWSKKGLYQLIPFSPAVKHYVADADQVNGLASSFIFNVINADQGTLWMGSPIGINIFNPITGFVNLLRKKDLSGIKGGSLLLPVNVDTIGKKAWILGEEGLFEMDLASRKCSVVMYEDSSGNRVALRSVLAHHPDPMYIRPYKNGCIIAASLPDHQEILVVNADDPVARKILSFPGEPIHLFRVFTNDDNLIFLRRPNDATNLTYAYHNNNWVCIPGPTDSIPWNGIFYIKTDKTYWINAETQLMQYDQNFRVIHSYTTEDGMPGVQIHGLIPDNKQNIWFTTDRSIFQLNAKTGTITMLAEKDGFLPQNFDELHSGTKDDDGDLYFPVEAGFYRINPGKYVFSASTVYFESLKINQKTFPLAAGINHVEDLSLKYFENNIVIETGTIDYYSKGKGHMRYKLEAEGKKADWQYAPAYYTIRYEELPPGKYKLMTQSSNAANEFNGPEKILFINISLPFWSTWWFRVLAAFLGLSSIYGFTQYRSRNLQERNIQLERKITERTSELNNSLIELKTTQDQLIQSEKMASLGELTSGIAHEIKNPLNFINNFSEINLELLTEIDEEQVPHFNESIKEELAPIIKNLIKNSEKINHHGKRVDDIVKGMLQHSRLGNITKETIDINALCVESMKLAYHGYRAKERTFNATYETRLEPDLPKVKCIPQDLGRVFLNIINNAFYAVAERSKQIKISAHEKQKQLQTEPKTDKLEIDSIYKPTLILTTRKIEPKTVGSGISITISDNGIGIPPLMINKVFQPFFTTKPTGEGTGLGLSMAYDIITKGHGGELKVKSKEGLGTDFEIILPVTEPQSEIVNRKS